MAIEKEYHLPILEKKYSRLLNAIEVFEKEHSSKKSIISKVFSKVKKILLYELPIEISIEERTSKDKKKIKIEKSDYDKRKSNVA